MKRFPVLLAVIAGLFLSGTSSYAQQVAEEEIKVIKANGLSFSYVEKGRGPLVLLLHGYPETAWSWDHLRTRLAESGYHAVALFMRGYPPTQSPKDSDYTVRALGDDVLALIDALGAETAIVVGHDWGASAVYAAVTKSPGKIEKLVAISIPHPKGLSGDLSALLEAPHFLYYQLPTSKWWVSRNNFSHLDRIYKSWAPTFTPSADDMSNIKDTLRQPGALDAALGYYWSFRKAGEEGLGTATPDSKIDIPSLVISGDQDVIDQARFDTARSAFTGPYEFRLFENVGHFPQLEVPEELAEEILRFLRQPPP